MTKSKIKSMKQRILLLSFVMGMVLFAQAQTRTLTGKVTGADDGAALPGVNVSVKGTTTGTITDIDGNYKLDVSESDVLVFSYIGYATQELTAGSKSVADIVLAVDAEQLDEVVVTALGIEKSTKALGYSATEIGNEEFTRARETNVVNSLSGKVAGVQITQSSAGLGSSSNVVIRGNASVGGNNQPLYVIDGIPMDNSSAISGADEWGNPVSGPTGSAGALGNGGSDLGSGISDLNPDDIESMSVLKGPAATALYGSRGANGVIMITTKKNSKKGLGVDFSSTYTMEQAAVLPKFQNEYGTGSQGVIGPDYNTLLTQSSWGPRMDGSQQITWTGDGELAPYSAQPDNFKDFFETGHTFSNSVAVSHGSDQGFVRLSVTDVSSEGIVPGNTLDRTSFTLRGKSTLGGKLTADAKISYVNQKVENRPPLSLWPDNPVLTLSQMGRNVSIDDLKTYQKADGSSNSPLSGFFNNPYYVSYANENEDTRNRFFGFTSLEYKVTDWLSAMVRVGTDFTSQKYRDIVKIGHTFRPTGTFGDLLITNQETNADWLLKFNKDFGSDLSVNVNVGGNTRRNYAETIGFGGDTWIAPNTYTVSNLTNSTSVSNIIRRRVNSLYGTASVSYKNILFLDVTGRNDWYSTLPEDNNSLFYPSVSTSVVVSDLLNMDYDVLSFLKVRASWAQAGNDAAPYSLYPVYNFQGGITYNGNPVANAEPNKKNENLRPEVTTSVEVGLDARFWNDRLNLDFTYYTASTEDQIFQASTPLTSGYTSVAKNAGEIKNSGVEIALGAKVIESADLNVDFNVTFTKNKSEVISLYDDVTRYVLTQGGGGGKVQVVADVGKPYGEIIGFGHQINPEDGSKVYTASGMPVRSSEMQSFGNINPDFLAGFGSTVSYKNFSLYFLVDMKYGGNVMSVRDAVMNSAGTSVASLEGREGGLSIAGSQISGTASDGSNTYTPLTVDGVNAQTYHSTIWSNGILNDFVYDAGFIKMREISLSYNMPSALLSKTPFSRASLSLVGRNLFFFKKHTENFDPETSFSTTNGGNGIETFALPSTRSYGVSLNISF